MPKKPNMHVQITIEDDLVNGRGTTQLAEAVREGLLLSEYLNRHISRGIVKAKNKSLDFLHSSH